ncbi:MAG: 23S rRNA (guanosine(2251)-2'-O)-methyltransferase RlmB [Clostridia bacterium]|nr:23S rRNA (guanosine(2251)-2'-O)-methyltransferase RlmB [Clostridia bacterium]
MKFEGKNAVYELLNAGTTINKLLVQKDETGKIVALAKQLGVKIQFVDKKVLDKESVTGKHQGYIATTVDFEYSELEDLLSKDGDKLVVVLDEINDPHNLGSIIRVCECAGVDGIVIGKNRQVQVNETVVRCSAGAISHVKIARVTNINHAIEQMKQQGMWVYCADMDGQSMYDANLTGNVALVIGGEGNGVSRLTKSLCDGVISINLRGKVNSLNASVACGIVVYEALRQRG